MTKERFTKDMIRVRLKAEAQRHLFEWSLKYMAFMIICVFAALVAAVMYSPVWGVVVFAVVTLPYLCYLLYVFLKIRRINSAELYITQDRLMGITDRKAENDIDVDGRRRGPWWILRFASYGDYRSYGDRDAFSSTAIDDIFYVVTYADKKDKIIAAYNAKIYEIKE